MRRALLEQALIVARVGVIDARIRQDEHFLVKLDHPVVVVCHAGIVMAEGDVVWRRPDQPDRYTGPPVGQPPPTDWAPAYVEPIPPPREVPRLDHDAIDAAERRAARLTYTVGLAALAVLIALACTRTL